MAMERIRAPLVRAVAVLAATLALDAAAAPKIVPPRVEVVSLMVVSSRSDSQHFRVGLAIDNQNTEALALVGVRFTLRLGGEGVLDGQSSAAFTVDPLDRKTVEIDIETDSVSSPSRLRAIASGPAHALAYEIFGDLFLPRRVNNTLPFSRSGEVPLTNAAGP